MIKAKAWYLSLCLSIVFLGGFAGESGAITLWDDTLEVHGFLKNETGIRLQNRSWYDPLTGLENAKTDGGQLSRCRTTGQLETEWSITKNLRLNTIFRAYYEAKYSLDNDIFTMGDPNDLYAVPRGEGMRQDFDVRECYLLYSVGDFTIRAGRQQIVWGEADGLRMADIINPLDTSWDFMFADWEDIRIPQRMLDIVYTVPGSQHDFQIEVVVNPEDFRATSLAPYGDNFYMLGDLSWLPMFAGVPIPGINSTQSLGGAVFGAMNNGLPDEHDISNIQGGMRVRGVFGGWDIHLYDYCQRKPNPVLTTNPVAGFGPFDPFDDTFGLRAHYPYMNTLGATFNVFDNFTGTVFRGECGYIMDEPFTTLDPALGGFFGTDYMEKDTFSYMLGFDRPTMIRFLNPLNSFFISGQIFQKFIFDYDDDDMPAQTGLGKNGESDWMTVVTLLINTEYWDARIKPEFFIVHDLNGQNGFMKPRIAYEPTYDWRLELGVVVAWGDNYTSGNFGPVKDCDEVYCMLEYKF